MRHSAHTAKESTDMSGERKSKLLTDLDGGINGLMGIRKKLGEAVELADAYSGGVAIDVLREMDEQLAAIGNETASLRRGLIFRCALSCN